MPERAPDGTRPSQPEVPQKVGLAEAYAALETLLKDHFWGRVKCHEIIFRLLVLELWGQRFIKPPVFSR